MQNKFQNLGATKMVLKIMCEKLKFLSSVT
jgi:hypothetical protein